MLANMVHIGTQMDPQPAALGWHPQQPSHQHGKILVGRQRPLKEESDPSSPRGSTRCLACCYLLRRSSGGAVPAEAGAGISLPAEGALSPW